MITYWFINQVFMSDISKGGILSILWKRAGLRNWNSAGDLNFYQGLFQFPAGLLAISAHPWTKGLLILASISSNYELFLPSFLVALYSIFNWLVDVITTCLMFTTMQTKYAQQLAAFADHSEIIKPRHLKKHEQIVLERFARLNPDPGGGD